VISRIFPVLAIAIFVSQLGQGIIAPMLPLYAEGMGASGIWIGIVFAGFSISQTIFMPLFGMLSDRVNRKLLLTVGLACYALMSLGYIWAPDIYHLAAIRLVHGAVGGSVIPIAQAYVGDLSPKGQQGRWMGYLSAAVFGGYGAGPIVGGALTEAFGISSSFYVMGGLNVIAMLLGLVFLPASRPTRRSGTGPSFSLSSAMKSKALQGVLGFQLTFSLTRSMLVGFFPILAATVFLISPGQIGVLLGVNILLLSLYQGLAGRLADRLNKTSLIAIGGTINLLFVALVPLSGQFLYLLPLLVVGAIGGGLALPAAAAVAAEEGKTRGMGTVMGALAMVQSLGLAVGPLLGGVMTDAVGVTSVFYTAAVLGALGVAFILIRARFSPAHRNGNVG
jgi:DHA1 family multidrug resistance protein-like MFS transporter